MDDIEKRLEQLNKKLDDLGAKEIERRVEDLVGVAINKWERKRGALILGILGILGFATYVQLQQKIVDHFMTQVIPKIDQEVKTKTAKVSTQDPAIAELQNRIAEIQKAGTALPARSNSSPATGEHVSATNGDANVSAVSTSAKQGYAFFGIREDNGIWSDKNFKIESAGDRLPQVGDIAVTTGSVNVRKGYITYGASGWTNQRTTGLLRAGDKVKIVEVKQVTDGFWWINFIEAPGR